ncbi:MAG: PEP-CTERM sorting domain-containing protein, partial [Verrucomicrobia bacterium]|nr:PEP-CTERM sorting domain-containing protein [Verrucomicrobiota bacterium]
SGSNAFVQLVDNRPNTAGAGSELLAVSNLIVATINSVLDLNDKSVFAYNLYNTGTVQHLGIGTPRVDVVNTFTNLGNVLVTGGGVLQFSNAFINAASGLIGLNGTLTNFVTGGVLTNLGRIGGVGDVWPVIGNEPSLAGGIAATGGTLRLMSGFTNSGTGPVNAGLIAALGGGSHLQVAQSFTNAGTIWLNDPTAIVTLTDSSSNLVNAAGALIQGQGTINAFLDNAGVVSNGTAGVLTFSLAVNNQAGGAVGAYSGSTIAFNGAVTNAGALTARGGSLLQFNQGLTLTGGGSLTLDPSTAIISGTLTLGAASILSLPTTNDVLVLRGDFANNSTNNMGWDTRWGTITFGNVATGVTNTFEVAGTNLGTNFAGFANNFALGVLNVTNHIAFVDEFQNGSIAGLSNEVLYVDLLHLASGATMKISQLTIYVGLAFLDDNTGQTYTSSTLNSGNNPDPLNIFFSNGGQIVFIPEPSTGALVGIGLLGLVARRRRRAKRRA